ncbi:PepSY domain-containing protein [Shewanella sp. VB17]|uniref:PepSY-associated TM helix domain-containing protein n=1 Tax=Shewanella sp. VB17 TaxID=2739432 RepID=UPI001566258A|nr:PepSY-associated TM helix domain-containing protein [Shewanella sp. VB17]NRD75434.1 PepSY domain-containing protein [Shewanella sp. VB17]
MANPPSHKKNLSFSLKKQLRSWHRGLGIFSAIFVLLLAISGILINHSHQFAIDNTHVEQAWLLDYYGIKPPNQINIYQTTAPRLASSDNLIWVDKHLALEADSPINGIVTFGDMLIAIDSDNLYLMSAAGEMLEKQDITTGLPAGLSAIANDGHIWLNADNGSYMADDDLIEWTQAMTFAPLPWAQPLTETVTVVIDTQDITQLARSHHLSWERVLLDVHSGRFFGPLGPWFMDLVALALIIMALSGVYLWVQHKPKKIKRK